MASVVRIPPDTSALRDLQPPPAWLRSRKQWHNFDLEAQAGGAKPAKIPVRLDGKRRTGAQGTPYDLTGLGTWDEALECAIRQGRRGVALALLPDCGIVVVDADGVKQADGSFPPELEAECLRTFSEVSVGGEGMHLYYRGYEGEHRFNLDTGSYRVDIFSEKGWIAYTGREPSVLDCLGPVNTIAMVSASISAMVAERSAGRGLRSDPDDFMVGYEPTLDLPMDVVRSAVHANDPSCPRDPWRTIGMGIHHQTNGSDEGFDLWHEWSQEGINYTGEEGMRYQWERFREAGEGPRVTFASVLKMAKDAGWVPENDKPVSAETLREEAASATQDTFDGKFRPTRASRLSDKPTQWHIKGILPSTLDPVILFGSSGAGKSFVALELACSIVRGVAWRGHRVRKGRVLYIAAEGMGGIRKRLQAYCRKHEIDIDDLDIDVIGASPNILEVDDVKEITKSIAAFGPYDLVIVDTLAQVTPGANENAGEDMGKALANIKAVQRATGATVMVIHHAGKDTSKGARGWSGIKAAAEAQIEVYRDEETGARHIHIEKMKDGEDGMRLGFTLETMVLSMDEDGDEVSSCVVTEAEFVAPVAKSKGGPVRGVTVRGGVQGAIAEAVHSTDPSLATMRLAAFIDEVMKLMPEADEGKRDTRRQNVARAIRSWSGKADAPLSIQGELVVFHE